ncbi:MAG: HAMP domain-containing sensor histidine kinase [Longimicrobiales bacterium]
MKYLAEDLPAAEIWGFLTGVSRHLSASLDLASTLTFVSSLSLPYPGSWCIVEAPATARSRRITIIHPDPEKQRRALRLTSLEAVDSDALDVLIELAGRSVVCVITDDILLEVAGGNAEDLVNLRALAMGSIISVPLLARGTALGTITFISSASEPVYSANDAVLAEDVASRCAMALDNARLYTEADEARGVAMRMNERLLVATVQQQELAEEARAANLATSRFLATMSHEFRTPLGAIIGYGDLIGLGIAGPVSEQQKEYVEKIRISTHHLVGIIDDILDLAKVQAGEMRVNREKEPVSPVIDAAISFVETQASKAGLRIDLSGLADPPAFYCGDDNRVRQILTNMLSNAVKFTPAGGTIGVECETVEHISANAIAFAAGPWIVMRVRDNGVGIDEASLKDVFKPFVQLDSSKTRIRGGTGLGLTISRELARRMGGDLTLTSEKGVGSCFSLWLPAELADCGEADLILSGAAEPSLQSREMFLP